MLTKGSVLVARWCSKRRKRKSGSSLQELGKVVVVLLLPYETLEVDLPSIENILPLSCVVPSQLWSFAHPVTAVVPPVA